MTALVLSGKYRSFDPTGRQVWLKSASMSEIMNHEIQGLQQHRRLACLLWMLGLSQNSIAEHIGCGPDMVLSLLPKRLSAQSVSVCDLLQLFERFDLERNILEIIGAESGSAQQARLRASLRARLKQNPKQKGADMQNETSLKTLGQLEEMSCDELRDYVVSLVPGLEHKERVQRCSDSETQDTAFSDHGAAISETSKGQLA